MIFKQSDYKEDRLIFCETNPFRAYDATYNEFVDNIRIDGSLIVFANLEKAINDLFETFARGGSLEMYGDSISAAWWRFGSRGAKLCGLNGYRFKGSSIDSMRDFWNVLHEITSLTNTPILPTAGGTAIQIAQSLSQESFIAPVPRLQNFCRGAYAAGARHNKSGRWDRLFNYDLKSAYSWAMSSPLPFGQWRIGAGRGDRYSFFISRCVIDYDSDLSFSPLWVRGNDSEGRPRVFHPAKARDLVVCLNSIDLATLAAHGRLTVKQELDRVEFIESDLLANAMVFFESCAKEYPQFAEEVKTLRNSIYGKLCQNETQFKYTLKDTSRISNDKLKTLLKGGSVRSEYNGFEYCVIASESKNKNTFSHAAVASAITAKVRQCLYNTIDDATVLTRTDSILSTKKRSDIKLGSHRGEWALKSKGEGVVFGSAGYLLGKDFKLDGAQTVREKGGAMIAETEHQERFAFKIKKSYIRQWRLHIEADEESEVIGDRITMRFSDGEGYETQAHIPTGY